MRENVTKSVRKHHEIKPFGRLRRMNDIKLSKNAGVSSEDVNWL
jgi:hypothetical protein